MLLLFLAVHRIFPSLVMLRRNLPVPQIQFNFYINNLSMTSVNWCPVLVLFCRGALSIVQPERSILKFSWEWPVVCYSILHLAKLKGITKLSKALSDSGSSPLVNPCSCSFSRFYCFCSYVASLFLLISNQQSEDDSLLTSAWTLTANIKACCIQPIWS